MVSLYTPSEEVIAIPGLQFYRPLGIGHYLTFASGSQNLLGSGASLDDLQANAFTAEAWGRPTSYGTGGTATGHLMSKRATGSAGGWNFYINAGSGFRADLICATTNAASLADTTQVQADSNWHHYAMTWDNAGTRKIRLFYDGVEVTYSLQTAGVGTVTTDASNSLRMGSYDGTQLYWVGDLAWARVSNVVRYTGTFTPPGRCYPPANDANTKLLLKLLEGTGNPADSSGNGNNGTLTSVTWKTCVG